MFIIFGFWFTEHPTDKEELKKTRKQYKKKWMNIISGAQYQEILYDLEHMSAYWLC